MATELKTAIIDDHNLLRRGICSIIETIKEPHKFKIIFDVENGLQMIDQINNGKVPDIVFLDINMPEMNGFQASEWLQINHPRIIIVALTMYDSPSVVAKMIKNGTKAFLKKNTEPQELSIAISDILSKGYYYTDFLTESLIKVIKDGEFSLEGPTNPENAEEKEKFDNLRNNEKEFLKLLCTELTYEKIADILKTSPKTIDGYRDRMFELFQVKSRVGLVLHLIKNKLVLI